MNVSKTYSFYHIIYRVSLIGILLLIGSSCAMLPEAEQEAQVDMPKSYSRKGLEFKYPGNWTVQELGNHFATEESPGKANVSIFGQKMLPFWSENAFRRKHFWSKNGSIYCC